MGCGSYTSSDWKRFASTRSISDTSNERELFRARNLNPKYNPANFAFRESRDNDEHPHSTPIAIGLDVTGSMGYLPAHIIKNGLNELMKKLYASNAIPDPQLMFAACGDYCDDAPLQVTHFESDIRIAEQLTDLWLEGGGCGNGGEDYQLFWYFLGEKTKTDAYEKRGEKGFAFTIGDEPVHDRIYDDTFKYVFGDTKETMKTSAAADICGKKYELFHININNGWRDNPDQIPGRTLQIDEDEVDRLPELIIAVMCKVKGVDRAAILGDLDDIFNTWLDERLKTLII